MLNLFKKDKPQKSISKLWDQVISQLGKSNAPIEEVKSDGKNVILKFFKEGSKNKIFEKEIVISVMICSTIFVIAFMLMTQANANNSRIDRFHRDIINKCIDKGWDVALYKDGQLESCEDRNLEING